MPNNGIWNWVVVKALIRHTGIIKQERKQGYKDNYSICGAYLYLAYAGQRKPEFLY